MAKEMLEQKDGEDTNIFKIVDNGNPGDILQQQANGDKTFVDPQTVDVLPTDGDPGDLLTLDIAGDEQWVPRDEIDTLPDGDEHDVLTLDDTDAKVFEPIPIRHFLPAWVPGEYFKGTLTIDDGWTMLSNALTTDRPAPDAIGEPQLGFDNSELYLEDSNVSAIASGHIYTFTLDGWLQRLRVRVPLINPDITYRFIIVNVTTGAVSVIEQTEDLIANEWIDIAIGSIIVTSGTQLRIYIDALNSSSSTTVLGPWTKVIDEATPGVAPPASGSWNLTTLPTVLNIHKVDGTPTDRTADLQTLAADTVITFEDPLTDEIQTFTITEPGTDEGTFFSFPYDVTSGDTIGDDIDCNMVATIPIPSSTAFIHVEDHWISNPDYAVITGFVEFNGDQQPGFVNNGFGVDIQFQEAFVSPDWDFVAGGGVIVSPVFVVSTDDTLIGLGIDTDRLGVAQPFTDDDRIKLDGIEDDAIATVATDGSISGIGLPGFELALSIQSDASLVGAGSVADPVEIAVQSDASLTGVGSVASPLSVTPQARYGEIFATGDLTQGPIGVGSVLIFDTDGAAQGVTVDALTGTITILEDGTYDVFIQGSVDHDNDFIYEMSVRIDTVVSRSLGKFSVTSGTDEFDSFGLGAVLALTAGEVIDIFVSHPGGGGENFDIFAGTRFHIIRLGD